MERMHFVLIRATAAADGAAFAAYVSDAWIVAAQREAFEAGRSDCVASGEIVLAAILAVMWVNRLPRAYAGAVQVNGEGRLQWRYRLDCAREEVCQACGWAWDIRFLQQGVCETCRAGMPLVWSEEG